MSQSPGSREGHCGQRDSVEAREDTWSPRTERPVCSSVMGSLRWGAGEESGEEWSKALGPGLRKGVGSCYQG